MPKWKPYAYGKQGDKYGDNYGTRAQINYRFLDRLWDTGQQLRTDLVKLAKDSLDNPQEVKGDPQKKLKDRLKDELDLDLPSGVGVVVVNLQNAEMVSPTQAYAQSEFYILFLPANPIGSDASFIDAQKWAEAWYHAVRETGGM